MRKAERDAIIAAFYKTRADYDQFVTEFERLFNANIDPSVPSGCIYATKHRLKDERRLIEKLDEEAKKRTITPQNYAAHIKDLLGLRIVCLRLSDVERIGAFLDYLFNESKLKRLAEPELKKTFILEVDPRKKTPTDVDLQYSGYSSVHYLIGLGDSLHLPTNLLALRAELQVRTLLEEAWGEIDHKYRYELTRTGQQLPAHIETGFYSFAAYLQAATLQSEYLCAEVDSALSVTALVGGDAGASPPVGEKVSTASLRKSLSRVFGFMPGDRTLYYVARRLRESRVEAEVDQIELKLLTPKVIDEFTKIYIEIARRDPFEDENERDVDAINALNFALARARQGEMVATAGIRDVLRRRFEETYTYEMVFEGEGETKLSVDPVVGLVMMGTVFVRRDDNQEWEVVAIEPSQAVDCKARLTLRPVKA